MMPFYEQPRPSIFFFIELEQKKLSDRVADAVDEAVRQLKNQPSPCLALNLERAQMDFGPTSVSPWRHKAQETADECWASLHAARDFNRFDWMCVYQNFPPVPDRRQPKLIIDSSHLDSRRGGSSVTRPNPLSIGLRNRTWT